MIASYTHSRAAILCFGGWGLQVMFHLLPRLQAAQEQRAALGAVAADLSKITSFATILAEPLLDPDGRTQFYVRQPKLDQVLPPFYIERALTRLERESTRTFDEQTTGLLTFAEKRAMLLLAETEPMLRTVEYNGRGFFAPATGLALNGSRREQATRRATRLDSFRTGLIHAEHLARLLETTLLDPIRQDMLVEDDPFVQTTLYVVAPLFEPLAPTLIWPLVAQLMARTGRQHVAQVIGLFATGSYATDVTRPMEDAAAFAALAELEALTGIRREAMALNTLHPVVDQAAPYLTDRLGEPLFDAIYLLDREKSNQGLAQNSHELAVVAANALEALSVAGGNLFIGEQLGYGGHAGEGRPYSLIGAACDHVPLAPIFHAVNRQEESRLVREWVLRNTEDEGAPLAESGDGVPNLSGMEAAAVAQATLRLPGVLTPSAPTTIDALDVQPSFVLPPALAANLRTTPVRRWQPAFQQHVDELTKYIRLAVGSEAMDEALGTQAVSPQTEWFLHDADHRLLPTLVTQMQEQLLDRLATSPTGLPQAQSQVRRWLHEVNQARQQVRTIATPNARQLARVQRELALRNWEAAYAQAAIGMAAPSTLLVRILLAIGLVILVAVGYLLWANRTWDLLRDGLTLLGVSAGISVVGAFIYRLAYARIRRLRRARVALAQTELRTLLQESVTDGLVAAYDRLAEVLTDWVQMLNEAASELSTLSTAPTIPAVPPPGVPLITLHQPHLNPVLWDRCLAFLRRQQDAQGHLSEERLDKIWGTPGWRSEMRRILSGGVPSAGQNQARTVAQFIRETVRQSVSPVSIEQPNAVRAELIRQLAKEFSIEHLLWRSEQEEAEITRRLRALAMGVSQPPLPPHSEPLTNRRYVENAWSRAKPAGNHDVADRLAVYGTVVDFATASGKADSDLTRALLEEFNVTLLPTDNPFSITFVRTVHGLGLRDLDAVRRYRDELAYLSAEESALILLASDRRDPLYRFDSINLQRPPRFADFLTNLNLS
jgi:hypothetical protein